ncbi:pantoate--beta-alanine ligase [candidate division WOR-3 bacterium]|nr:pantoate--beta-alanine ligase [candidate division WOR-3 bacterium]
MRLVKSITETKKIIKLEKNKGKIIGFVPTMGYLHKGHLSLVHIARRKSEFLVVSIFVNPTQFSPDEDLKKYPRDMKRDLKSLKQEGTDLVFYPSVKQIYPSDYKTYVQIKDLSRLLCGVSRPHHFRGVTTVVLKLFNIIKPDIAVFGQKDYQQAVIIKRMVKDLCLNIKILLGKIIREKDGLAMSSRNIYLSTQQRENATVLYQSLKWVKWSFNDGLTNPKKAIKKIRVMIKQNSGKVDYIVAVNKNTLEPVKRLKKGTLIALAAYFGKTRLIDNTIL